MSDNYIIVFSQDPKHHPGHFHPIRTVLVEANVYLKFQKCTSFSEEVNKVGYYMGTFRSSLMPVHLHNAQPTFQHALDIILLRARWQISLTSDDYIIVFSQDPTSHPGHFNPIRTLLVEADVNLELLKYSCFPRK